MNLWLTRRRGDRFQAVERVSLHGFEDLFEADLARAGQDIRLVVEAEGQEVRIRGLVLPSMAELRKSGRADSIEKRVAEDLSELTGRLGRRAAGLSPARTATARDSLAVLDALLRARKPLAAIVSA